MKTVEMPVHRSELQKALRGARQETVVLTRRGKPFAAVIPLEGADVSMHESAISFDSSTLVQATRCGSVTIIHGNALTCASVPG
jgi:antitoxin (DNA-binding transcriptional repressor) of toxin-antitoxin stability system